MTATQSCTSMVFLLSPMKRPIFRLCFSHLNTTPIRPMPHPRQACPVTDAPGDTDGRGVQRCHHLTGLAPRAALLLRHQILRDLCRHSPVTRVVGMRQRGAGCRDAARTVQAVTVPTQEMLHVAQAGCTAKLRHQQRQKMGFRVKALAVAIAGMTAHQLFGEELENRCRMIGSNIGIVSSLAANQASQA